MGMFDGMLPKESKEGYCGYYPVTNRKEWNELPELYKAMEWKPVPDPLDKGRLRAVKSVIFDVVYMEPYKINAKVSVHPQEVQKILFCNFKNPQCHLYSICEAELEGGTRLRAKWVQDRTTGAFAVMIGKHYAGMQGGFGGIIPECIEKCEDGSFKWKGYDNYSKTNHYTFSNPFEDEKKKTIQNAKLQALREGYGQFVIEDANGNFSFSRAGYGKPISVLLDGEKIVGKVDVEYENGVRVTTYKDILAEDMRTLSFNEDESQTQKNFEQIDSVESRLIHAMVEYGLENLWSDSDVIDALCDLGVKKEDFEVAGYGEFVKKYFEKPSLDQIIGAESKESGQTKLQETEITIKQVSKVLNERII